MRHGSRSSLRCSQPVPSQHHILSLPLRPSPLPLDSSSSCLVGRLTSSRLLYRLRGAPAVSRLTTSSAFRKRAPRHWVFTFCNPAPRVRAKRGAYGPRIPPPETLPGNTGPTSPVMCKPRSTMHELDITEVMCRSSRARLQPVPESGGWPRRPATLPRLRLPGHTAGLSATGRRCRVFRAETRFRRPRGFQCPPRPRTGRARVQRRGPGAEAPGPCPCMATCRV
jgi:hypothetical protein